MFILNFKCNESKNAVNYIFYGQNFKAFKSAYIESFHLFLSTFICYNFENISSIYKMIFQRVGTQSSISIEKQFDPKLSLKAEHLNIYLPMTFLVSAFVCPSKGLRLYSVKFI